MTRFTEGRRNASAFMTQEYIIKNTIYGPLTTGRQFLQKKKKKKEAFTLKVVLMDNLGEL